MHTILGAFIVLGLYRVIWGQYRGFVGILEKNMESIAV